MTPGLSAGTEGDASVTFCGTYDPVEIGEGGDNTKLYFSDRNTLYWPNGAMTINSFRAYLQLNITAATRSIVLNIGEKTTRIIEVQEAGAKVQGDDADGWFTIDGVRHSGKLTKKGLYINHGKKIVVK